MNICFVTESFYPEIDGGAVHSRLLAEHLQKAGNNVLIVTRRPRIAYPRREIISGCLVFRVGLDDRFGVVGRYLGILTILLPLITNRRKYDIVMIAAPRIIGAPVIMLMKLMGKKCVVKPDSCGEMDGSYALRQLESGTFTNFAATTYFRIRNSILKRAHAYIAISSVIHGEMRDMGIGSELIVDIPNGVDIDKYKPLNDHRKRSLRIDQQLPEKAVIFAYCGRLTSEKGLTSLLRVWKRLTEEYESLHLLLIGSGEGMSLDCEGELRSYVQENGLDRSVTFTGPLEDVRSYLNCADIFVLLSKTEALGIALIEAQLCGIPAIATRVGGIPDVITHNVNGVLVTPENDDELFVAASELVENYEKRIEMGLSAREMSAAQFSISLVKERYISLLKSVSAGKAIS